MLTINQDHGAEAYKCRSFHGAIDPGLVTMHKGDNVRKPTPPSGDSMPPCGGRPDGREKPPLHPRMGMAREPPIPYKPYLPWKRTRQVCEKAIRTIWFCTAIFAAIAIFFIFIFLVRNSYPIFEEVGVWNFITGDLWNPTGTPPSYGIYRLIAGTLLVTLGAMTIAIPLGIASAVFIAELAPPRVRAVVKPAIELLAGIPSVVYGFFGLVILTDQIRIVFDVASGETWLAGSILLGIMALPTIVSISEDAIRTVPRGYREGSLALGATHWQTITGTVIPAALSGITAAIILGMGRAIGETMAVIGNRQRRNRSRTLWDVLSGQDAHRNAGNRDGEVAVGSTHYHALFGVAVVLLAITLAINLLARGISRGSASGTRRQRCGG